MGLTLPVEAVDAKRLARLAREPTRVFGFTEVRTYRWPVSMVSAPGAAAWFGPGHGPWLFKGDDCSVLLRAIEKMGVVTTNESHAAAVKRQLDAEGIDLELPPATLVTLGDKHIVAVHQLLDREPIHALLIPAVPVTYAERRWSDGRWVRLVDYPVVRYHDSSGQPVGLVAAIQPTEGR